MNVTSIVEEIKDLCEEVQTEVEFLKTLAGKASDPKWAQIDPEYVMLKGMAQAQADIVIVKAQALRDAIPE